MKMKTGYYRHTRTGNVYKVLGVAKHSETLEDMVVYEACYENAVSKRWVRPLALFTGDSIHTDGLPHPRFVYLGEEYPPLNENTLL